MPSWQIVVTKPQFVLLSCIAESWVNSMIKAGKVASVPKAVIDSVFYPAGKQSKHYWQQCFCSANCTHMSTYSLYIFLYTLGLGEGRQCKSELFLYPDQIPQNLDIAKLQITIALFCDLKPHI